MEIAKRLDDDPAIPTPESISLCYSRYAPIITAKAALNTVAECFGLENFKLPKQRSRRERKEVIKFLTKEEIDYMVLKLPDHLSLMVQLMFETGLRLSEFINLKKENINIKENYVKGTGKGLKPFKEHFGENTSEKLKQWISFMDDMEYPFHYPDVIHHNKKFWRELKLECKKIGMENIHPHRIRHCIQEEAEILTVNGWKNRRDLKIGDTIYSYNLDKDQIENDVILEKYSYFVDEPLNHIKNNYIDYKVTDEHNLVLNYSVERQLKYKRWDEQKGINLIKLSKIKKTGGLRVVKHKLSSYKPEGYSIGLAKAGLLGWVLTDGCISKKQRYSKSKENIGKKIRIKEGNPTITLSQSLTANKKKCDLIDNLFEKSGLKYTAHIQNPKINDFNGNMFRMKNWRLSRENTDWVFEWINKDKTPKWKLLSLKGEELKILFNCMILADGSRGTEFTSQSEKHIEFLATLTLMLDKRIKVSYGIHNFTKNTKRRTYISNRNESQIFIKKIKKVRYKGFVWCPKTNNNTFLCRCNDTYFITGNSLGHSLRADHGFDLMEIKEKLRHKSIQTTQIYATATREEVEHKMKKVYKQVETEED